MDRVIGYALAVPAWGANLILFPPVAAAAFATSLAFRGWGGADAFFHAAADAWEDQLDRAARLEAERELKLEAEHAAREQWRHGDLDDLEVSIGLRPAVVA